MRTLPVLSAKDVLLLLALRVIRSIRGLISTGDVLAVIVPAPPGSLGDEALLDGFHYLASAQKIRYDEIVVTNQLSEHAGAFQPRRIVKCETTTGLDLLRLQLTMIRTRRLFIIGADTLDGSYNPTKNQKWVNIARSFYSAGAEVSFISFSFSANPEPSICQALRLLPRGIRFASRDAASLTRFVAETGHKCRLLSDLAFSMPASLMDSHLMPTIEWCRMKHASGEQVIAININPLPVREHRDHVLNTVHQSLQNILLRNKHINIVLVPHDFREGQSDQEFLAELEIRLHTQTDNRVARWHGPFRASSIKEAISSCDCVITGRMHLAIAALSQAIPVYGFAYKDKFEGLMDHFGLTGNLAPVSVLLEAEKLTMFLDHAIKTYSSLRHQISRKLPQVLELSQQNISNGS